MTFQFYWSIWGVKAYVSRGTNSQHLKISEKNKVLSTKDFLVTGESFDLLADPGTEMLVTHPMPAPSKMDRYYKSEDYISHSDDQGGFIPFLYRLVKNRALEKKTALINKLTSAKGNLLDIGTGTGSFLESAKKDGWNTTGVEPGNKARALAIKKGLIVKQDLKEVQHDMFDVITLWHVLEHLHDLESVTAQIESMLSPGGTLIIAVPNYRSYDARYYKQFWAAYDVPRHLWHFSRKSMTQIFSEKMKLKQIKPMIFDSFYVSLLSEKYKSGNSFSIRAIFIGLWSNITAWRTKEYSSLIYCFKKTK
jgi:2-polyprenyl-3-methyl-5-hydroxy-6-metoxy-1,4-benzoquinol methylase